MVFAWFGRWGRNRTLQREEFTPVPCPSGFDHVPDAGRVDQPLADYGASWMYITAKPEIESREAYFAALSSKS